MRSYPGNRLTKVTDAVTTPVTYENGNSISYGYDASGRKLSVTYRPGSTVTKKEYAGNKVYSNGTLSLILTEEGYVTPGASPAYYYYLKDHQGNNRVIVDRMGFVQQVNHYYPFGGLFGEALGEGAENLNHPYRYSGKELDRNFDLDMSDHGARHYDAALGRWFVIDLIPKYTRPILKI